MILCHYAQDIICRLVLSQTEEHDIRHKESIHSDEDILQNQ